MKRTPMKRMSAKRAARNATGAMSEARAAVMDRARGRCEWSQVMEGGRVAIVCEAAATEAHHMLPRSAGGPDTLDNLLALCGWHHDYVHANPAESYAHGWLIRRTAPASVTNTKDPR